MSSSRNFSTIISFFLAAMRVNIGNTIYIADFDGGLVILNYEK